MPKKISSSTRYAFAIGTVAVATLIRMLLSPFLGSEFPFLSYYIAVVLTTWFAGFSPAILSIALGFIAADVFVYSRTAVEADSSTIILFLIVTMTIAFLGKAMHEARNRAEFLLAESRQRQREVEQKRTELEEEFAEHKKTQSALCLAEENFQTLFENAAVGSAQVDPATGRFMRVNDKLCQITGYSREELLGMTFRQITYPADNEWDTRTFRRMIEGQTPQAAVEKRYIAKDGRTIWVNVAAAMVRDKQDGKPLYTLSIIQDVNARRQADEALQGVQHKLRTYSADLEKQVTDRTAQLAETVHTLEGFCYTVAHELRTPIHAVHGYATILAEKCSLNPQALDYTEHICSSATRMDQLIQDLLTYGRLAHEPMPCEPLTLEAVVDHVLAKLAVDIDYTKALITVEHPLPQVLGHPDALEQVLLNLLQNALKFVRPSEAPRVTIRTEELPNAIRIWVNDNGIGIEPQAHEKIFQIFERAHNSNEYRGTGTGLAIVRKAVERMGGRVGVISLPGTGSSFWFELGRVHVGNTAPAPAEERAKVERV